MAEFAVFKVIGAAMLSRKLAKMPRRVQSAAVRKGLRAAGQVVLKEARKRAPRGDGTGGFDNRKPLRKALTKKIKVSLTKGQTFAIVGPRSRDAPHAHLVHSGTRRHEIGQAGQILRIGDGVARGAFDHPGAKADPFLENAFNATRLRQRSLLEDGIRRELERVAKQT